ncbi:MAG: hypothetical protein JO368_01435 [Acidimicrobiales bacterium]|nr:hypothetical protein [Acidimicrobiales bacterium]
MSAITLVPPPPPKDGRAEDAAPPLVLRVTRWVDPVTDKLGVHPCSRYVELYWLGVLGPSATWLLRRVSYGLEVHEDGFDLHLAECARSLGLGSRLGKNSPFLRAVQRLCVFEVARPAGPGGLAVRTVVPPLPLRHVQRLPPGLQRSHRRWLEERRLVEPEQMRRRALRLACELAEAGKGPEEIERRLAAWHFHPAIAYRAARDAAETIAGRGAGDEAGGNPPTPGTGRASGDTAATTRGAPTGRPATA